MKCILLKFGDLLVVSSLQFGFQKKLPCSHFVYTVRAVIVDYYVSDLFTVNARLLDLSKAFDRVKHDILSAVLYLLDGHSLV